MSRSRSGQVIVELVRARDRSLCPPWEVRNVRANRYPEPPRKQMTQDDFNLWAAQVQAADPDSSLYSEEDWAQESIGSCGVGWLIGNDGEVLSKLRRSARRVWLVGHIEGWCSSYDGEYDEEFEIERVITLGDIK